MKILVFSDTHIGLEGFGSPTEALGAALEHAGGHHPDVDLAVFLGDLVGSGAKSEYATLKSQLAPLTSPVHFIMGNHDDRSAFLSDLGSDQATINGFVQHEAVIEGYTCLFLDTLDAGKPTGKLCSARLDWLDTKLSAATTPCLIFMHHPPIRTYTKSCDRIGLKDREAFAAILRQHPGRVEHILFGHCHFAIAGSVAGVPATGLGSVLYQNRPNQADERFLHAASAPGSYCVITGTPGETTIWFEEVPANGGTTPRKV